MDSNDSGFCRSHFSTSAMDLQMSVGAWVSTHHTRREPDFEWNKSDERSQHRAGDDGTYRRSAPSGPATR